jgi:DNA polymerase-3 subunit gamma/tau
MSYQVLARKWRPKTFAELVGQEHVVTALSNALQQNRLHHAYLLTGTRGVGKTTLARALAKALNCETGITPTPCGVCSSCQEIDSGRFIDLIELDAASNTQVDNMRELLENALYAPTRGRFKIYIIDEVHMLSKSAFNAMLKTLEEPPPHVKFVLATTDPQKIPVTVLSRCLQFNLKQIPPQIIAERLTHILEQEKISSDKTALSLLAKSAQGSMRDALSLLDQAIAYGGGKVEAQAVKEMLGTIDQTYLYEVLKLLVQGDGPGLIAQVEAIAKRNLSFENALQELAVILHTIALAQTVPAAIAEDETERELILNLAAQLNPEEVQLYYQIAIQGRQDLSLAPDEYAGFSMTLLRMLAFAPSDEKAMPAKDQPASSKTNPVSSVQSKAVASTAAPSNSSSSFDGNWLNLVNQLKVSGMAKMLAQNCELKNFSEAGFELCVPETHRHLTDKPYHDKLKLALSEHFGRTINVTLNVGNVTGMTPAAIESREKQEKQSKATAALEQDPFVQDLVKNFDAKLIETSIKPIQ